MTRVEALKLFLNEDRLVVLHAAICGEERELAAVFYVAMVSMQGLLEGCSTKGELFAAMTKAAANPPSMDDARDEVMRVINEAEASGYVLPSSDRN